jgi:predicted double-glycine peptidase
MQLEDIWHRMALNHKGDISMATYVPLVRQSYEYSCGAASLASCLYYWGVWSGREPELYSLLKTTTDGTLGCNIMQVASEFGLEVLYKRNLGIGDLKAYLDAGYTCILNMQAWGNYTTETNFEEVWEDGHYVVLVNLINDDIEVMDPSIAGQYGRLSNVKFETRWHDWSDDGNSKEYHTAILLRGQKVNDLSRPYRIDSVVNDAM